MFFTNFLKPKWQHKNPQVRITAVNKLAEDDPALSQLAQDDENTDVRCAAVGRLGDCRLLDKLMEDQHSAVQTCVKNRLINLAVDAETLTAVRDCAKKVLIDRHCVSELIAEEKDPDQRKQLLGSLSTTEEIVQLIKHDPSAEVRLAALDGIDDVAALQEIARDMRNRDKRLVREAKQRLGRQNQAGEQNQRIEQLCTDIEKLLELKDIKKQRALFDRYKAEWKSLQAVADSVMAERINQALVIFESDNRDYAERYRDKLAICDSLQSLLDRLEHEVSIGAGLSSVISTALQDNDRDWQSIDALEPADEARIRQQYQDLRKALKQRQLILENNAQRIERLQDFLANMGADEDKIIRAGAEKLEGYQSAWNKLPKPGQRDTDRQLQTQFESLLNHYRDAINQRKLKLQSAQKKITENLSQLKTSVDAGQLRQARKLRAEIRHLMADSEVLPDAYRSEVEHELGQYSHEISQLGKWAQWGSDHARENLVKQAEELLAGDLAVTDATETPVEAVAEGTTEDTEDEASNEVDSPETPSLSMKQAQERSKQIKLLRQNWRKLDRPQDAEAAEALWQRFDAALIKAWEPCQQFYAEQDLQRAENLQHRENQCLRLQEYLMENREETRDWRNLDYLVQDVKKQWRKAGMVDKEQWQKINDRYFELLNPLQQRLKQERKDNFRLRKDLIEKMQQLGEIEDWRETVDKAKQLQKQWVVTVASRRSDEQKLWNQFRQAADKVFSRRNAFFEQKKQEKQALLDQRQALCDELQQLIEADDAQLLSHQAELARIKTAWQTIETSDDEAMKKQQKQFDGLLKNLAKAAGAAKDRQKQQLWTNVCDALVCVRDLRALLESSNCAEGKTAIEQGWQQIDFTGMDNHRLVKIIHQRYQNLSALCEDAEALRTQISEWQDQYAFKAEIVLQLEVIAGVSAPQQDDMNLKIDRLQRAMTQKNTPNAEAEANRLLEQWAGLDTLPADKDEALDQRCMAAIEALEIFS